MTEELDGRENVIKQLVVGMSGQDDDGTGAYRDTLVQLPEPTDEDWVPFEDINEEWVMEIAERTAEANNWHESIRLECEAAKNRPVSMKMSFQIDGEPVEDTEDGPN